MPTIETSWLTHFGIFALMALLPFMIVACTSFAKVAVVLSITKNAIGGQGVVPLTVVTALSVVITIFIMGPVFDEMMSVDFAATPLADTDDEQKEASAVFGDAVVLYNAISPPLIHFLECNTPPDEISFFEGLDKSAASKSASVRILLVAFASNELIEAFILGFLVLIPFVLIDLIAANTLGALGLANLSVITVSLPLKVLLFVVADGWHMLINALVVSYGTQ